MTEGKTNQNRRTTGEPNESNDIQMKRLILLFGILALLAVLPEGATADRRGFVNTVVIDPGHGGKDPGTLGRQVQEKEINLAISLKLGAYINEYMPGVEVIYTRTTDEFVALYRRAQIANENKADLFISIHCNGASSRSAIGTETFVMGLDRSKANLEVTRKENAAILYEEDYMETYEGFDPHSPEANIIFTLYQNAYLDQSLSVASLVQNQFRERASRVDRGVKQAPFLVLYQITMPGILVEAGFLSNQREEEYLKSETGQAHIASAIFRAFRDYKTEQDALAASRRQYTAEVADSGNSGVDLREEVAQEQPETQEEESPHKGIVFRVQFASTSVKKSLDSEEFQGLPDLGFYFHDGMYKYTVGNETSLEEAAAVQTMMHEAGYKDAFVVAFVNEERISPAEAIRLVSQQETKP